MNKIYVIKVLKLNARNQIVAKYINNSWDTYNDAMNYIIENKLYKAIIEEVFD